MGGGMEVNKNRFIEDWNSARENLEYNFRWTRRNFAIIGIFGIAIPVLVYKGIVRDFTVKSLVEEETKGLDVNASNNNGCTPLDLLLQSRGNCRDMEIAKLLQDHGARRGSTTSTKKGHDEWVRNMSQSLMIVASLIATVAFTAIISPAGVFQEDTPKGPDIFDKTFVKKYRDEHRLAGISIVSYLEPDMYLWYYGANTIAFLFSVAIILVLVSGFSLRSRFLLWVLIVTMWAAILALVLAYFTASRFVSTDS